MTFSGNIKQMLLDFMTKLFTETQEPKYGYPVGRIHWLHTSAEG